MLANMSNGSFFGGVTAGIRTPDVVMNSGPLPPENMSGMPYGLDGNPDARINYNSTLLGDIDPYAYGEPSRLSTQSSYINIPNRIQKVIPVMTLPDVDHSNPSFVLSHSIDDGDVCFTLLDRHMKTVANAKDMDKMYSMRNYHPFINLATVNYLLAGMQLEIQHKKTNQYSNLLPDTWNRLVKTTFPDYTDDATGKIFEGNGTATKVRQDHVMLERLFDACKPFGIAHGSEKQGGGHEGTLSPVTWASNLVSTLYIDGYVREICGEIRTFLQATTSCFSTEKYPSQTHMC